MPNYSMRLLIILIFTAFTGACASLVPPNNTKDICAIFDQERDWYDDAKDSQKKWGTPIPVMMAIVHQESKFNAKARPPRKKGFWFFKGDHISTAYGYAQALDGTWDHYKRSTGNWGADRDKFKDAIDFVGWYTNTTTRKNNVPPNDTRNQYLNYHEGWAGYRRGTYRKKGWLMPVAQKVDRLSRRYEHQLNGCYKRFEKKWWWPF